MPQNLPERPKVMPSKAAAPGTAGLKMALVAVTLSGAYAMSSWFGAATENVVLQKQNTDLLGLTEILKTEIIEAAGNKKLLEARLKACSEQTAGKTPNRIPAPVPPRAAVRAKSGVRQRGPSPR